ncbi:MAG: heat-inducible transcriptional repressor HrcA [Candidatus Dormibacteraceae bacterium]
MEQRKQDVLKAVVTDFTVSGVPVGSHSLVTRHFDKLSSATIRNELAELAERGYLEQPHASAGRRPTDLGYRYFVDFLMDLEAVPRGVESYIELELQSAPGESQALAERMATVTAQVTGTAAVVSAPIGPRARVKHVDLVALEGAEVLLILLVEGNLLRQRVVSLGTPADQAALSSLAALVNQELLGRDRQDVEDGALTALDPLEAEVLHRLADALRDFEEGAGTLVVHDGVRNLLQQPEFADAMRLHEVLEVLEETRLLAALLQDLAQESDLAIVIGSEHATQQLRSTTVVLTTYGPSRRLRGIVGAIGPTRMEYGKIVGRLRAVARSASGRMAES